MDLHAIICMVCTDDLSTDLFPFFQAVVLRVILIVVDLSAFLLVSDLEKICVIREEKTNKMKPNL
jgi:hypothetical protein